MGTSLTHHVTPAALIEAHAPGVATTPAERTSKEAAKKLWQAMQTDGWDALNIAAYERQPGPSSGNHSDAVVAVDAEGNAAALLHTINTALWGTTGIFVDGVAIADSGKYQQTKIARAGPGRRLPIETNPVLITRNGKPVLVSSSIGMGVHEQTYQAIVNVLEYGLDPKAAAESPQVLRPMSGGLDRALGAEYRESRRPGSGAGRLRCRTACPGPGHATAHAGDSPRDRGRLARLLGRHPHRPGNGHPARRGFPLFRWLGIGAG